MTGRRTLGGLVAGASLATALLAPAAHAAPVGVDDFTASLAATIRAAGVTTAGQTLHRTQVDAFPMIRGGARQADVVNPDGSLVATRASATRTWQFRCVARDRCWERVLGRGSDRRWHRMPAGAISYATVTADMIVPSATYFPAAATFDVTPDGAAQVFTARYAVTSGTNVDRFTVAGQRVTRTVDRVDGAGASTRLLSTSFASTARPVDVRAPRRATLGRPMTARWTPRGSFMRSLWVYVNAA